MSAIPRTSGSSLEIAGSHRSTFAIGDVEVALSDPNIFSVGTCEVLMARSSYAGTGVFKKAAEKGTGTVRLSGLVDMGGVTAIDFETDVITGTLRFDCLFVIDLDGLAE